MAREETPAQGISNVGGAGSLNTYYHSYVQSGCQVIRRLFGMLKPALGSSSLGRCAGLRSAPVCAILGP